MLGNARVINFDHSSSDVNSPDKSFGIILSELSLNQTYTIGTNKANHVREKLYNIIFHELKENPLEDSVEVVPLVYKKHRDRRTESRVYIQTSYYTKYGNVISALVRLFNCGDTLYIGVSGYVLLSGISWAKLLIRTYFTFITWTSMATFVSFFYALNEGLGILLYLLSFFFPILFFWKSFANRIISNHSFGMALRKEFPKEVANDQFDYDDMTIFSKSTLNTITRLIRDVLDSEGISVDSLDEFAHKINNITIDTGGGFLQIIGSSIGIGNRTKTQ